MTNPLGFVVLARRPEPAPRLHLRARQRGIPGVSERVRTGAERAEILRR